MKASGKSQIRFAGAILLLAALSLGVTGSRGFRHSRRGERSRQSLGIYVPSRPAITSRFTTRESLAKLMETASREIPRRGGPSDTTGRIPLNVANELELIAEAARLNPDLAPDAGGFFRDCAEKRELVDAFRAVCYRQLLAIYRSRPGQELSKVSVSSRIRRIARRL